MINISVKSNNSLVFSTKDKFFSRPIKITKTKDYLLFTHVGVDYEGKAINFSRCKNTNTYRKTIFFCEIESGKYELEQDNEDCMKIYFK